MEGTAEARRLKQRVRLSRRETEWVGLHELAAFTQTDVKDDPVLRPLMEECGCGHLFSLEAGDYALEPKPLATDSASCSVELSGAPISAVLIRLADGWPPSKGSRQARQPLAARIDDRLATPFGGLASS